FSTPLEENHPKTGERPRSSMVPSLLQPEQPAATSAASQSLPTGSAFVKSALPAPPTAPSQVVPSAEAPNAADAKPAEPQNFMRPFTVTDAGDVSPSSLRNPQLQYHPHPHSHPLQERPFIPPPDVSYDTAWEQSRLTVPQESRHLSRAAAGAIIGIALAVIIGALAFNFRHDIGSMFIDLGQQISGDKTAPSEPAVSAPPQNSADTPSDSSAAADASNPSTSAASLQPSATHATPVPKKQETNAGRTSDSPTAAEKPAKQY